MGASTTQDLSKWLQGLGAEDIRVVVERFGDCFNICCLHALCGWPHVVSIVLCGHAASCAGAAPCSGRDLELQTCRVGWWYGCLGYWCLQATACWWQHERTQACVNGRAGIAVMDKLPAVAVSNRSCVTHRSGSKPPQVGSDQHRAVSLALPVR